MKVLLLHNRYRQAGGEDAVVTAEAALLRANGVSVIEDYVDNDVDGLDGLVQLAFHSYWSKPSYRRILQLCRTVKPDVAHVHNFWMQLSPSVHAACRDAGVRTVQTLHNFRLICLNALLTRNGKVCEDCVGKMPWRGILRRCYRSSFAASTAVATMIEVNRRRETWSELVDVFIALSAYSRKRLISGGIPSDRIIVKPNFAEDPGQCSAPSHSNQILYAGRLSAEKGLDTLLHAWAIGHFGCEYRLRVVGDGPEREALVRKAGALGLRGPQVTFRTRVSHKDVIAEMSHSRAVVLPSLCGENFPRSLAEAFSCGRPAVASDIGALAEIVTDRCGLRVSPGNPFQLAEALRQVLNDRCLADRLGAGARAEFLSRYTPEENYRTLMNIYQLARDSRRSDTLPCIEQNV